MINAMRARRRTGQCDSRCSDGANEARYRSSSMLARCLVVVAVGHHGIERYVPWLGVQVIDPLRLMSETQQVGSLGMFEMP